jgi:hypothetical protein
MANTSYILLNAVVIGGAKQLRPGETITTPSPTSAADVAGIEAAGGILWPATDATVAAAAAIVLKYVQRGRDELRDSCIMLAAAASSALTNGGGGGGGGAQTVVNVNAAASPYAAVAGQTVVVDASGGNVVVNLPVLTAGQFVQVVHDPNTSLAVHTITINGPGAVQLSQPPPTNGTFGNNYVLSGAQSSGMSVIWFNGGSAGGYLLE